MKLFLAATYTRQNLLEKYPPLYVLESFYYVMPWQMEQMHRWKMFLLDSGAFTFISNQKKQGAVDFDAYLDRYINFINQYDIKYFFELDIDAVVGFNKVLEYRKKLEEKTGKKCIPVWHRSRGLENWIKTTQEYNYVAIGGFAIKTIKKEEYRFIPELLKIAKQNGCKVHGLGFTSKAALNMDFYSVDSTNWLASSRFGGMEYFDGKRMVKVKTPEGKKTVHFSLRDEFILKEYIKFQHYLKNH